MGCRPSYSWPDSISSRGIAGFWQIIIDIGELRLIGHSAFELLNNITERHAGLGKKNYWKHLSADSRTMLYNVIAIKI